MHAIGAEHASTSMEKNCVSEQGGAEERGGGRGGSHSLDIDFSLSNSYSNDLLTGGREC